MKKSYTLILLFLFPIITFSQGIVVTEIKKTIRVGDKYELSVRNDGTTDLVFKVEKNSKGNKISIKNESAKTEVAAADMPHFGQFHGNYATAFEYEEDMGKDWVLDEENTIALAQNYGDHADDFKGKGKRFVGIKQKMPGGAMYHYGWIEVNVNEDASEITFVEMGFNQAHDDRVLFAGEKDIIDGVNKNLFESKFSIIAGEGSLEINTNSDEQVNYQLFDLAGNQLQNNKLVSGNNKFSTATLSKGVYLVNLTAGDQRLVKKLFLP